MPTTILSTQEFIAEQGGGPVRISDDTSLLPSGARIATNYRPGSEPVQYPPPEDLMKKLQARILYRKKALEVAETGFNELKQTALGIGDTFHRTKWPSFAGPQPEPTSDDDPDTYWLTQFRTLAREQREELTKLEAEFNELPQVVAQREIEQQRREVARKRLEDEAVRRAKINEIRL